RERAIEYVVNQSGLARTGDAGDDSEQAQREANFDVFQIVFTCAAHGDVMTVGCASLCRHFDLARSADVETRDRLGLASNFFRRASGHYFAAVRAGRRA